MKNRGWVAVGAAMAMLGMSSQVAAQSCITRAEVAGMVAYAMPSLITTARDQCRGHLPADAFVANGVDAMITSYRADQAQNWPAARAAFMKFGDNGNKREARMMAKMPDNVLQPMVDSMMTALVEEEIKPESCRDIDTILASLAPLSSVQAASLMAAIMALAGGDAQRQPAVCAE